MKKILRGISIFLISTLFLTLTACSGGVSGSAENELTAKVNSKLSGTGISVQYDKNLSEKALVYLDTYITSGNESQAIKAAGLNTTEYTMYATTATSSLNDAAAVIAGNIRAEQSSTNRVAKKLGYASGKLKNGQSVIFALVKF